MQSKSFILKTILIVLLIPVGCATQQAIPYVYDKLIGKQAIDLSKVQTLTFPQVKETILSEGLAFTSLKAKAGITITNPEINGEFKCKGVVRFQKHGKIRVIGSKLARTVFDMISDGENYWFYLPKEKVVYKGKCNVMRKTNTNAYIFPDDITALLEYDRLFERRQAYMETWPTFWLIHILDGKGEEIVPYGRLSVDRIDNTVAELTMFKPDSFVRVQASFHDYTEINGQSIPKVIQIHWPDTRTTLTLNLNNISINEPLKPEIFQFKRPKRAEIIEIN
ncbi:MAG: outer membrane lipoprotein carrier protein LolA [Candidatus Scalindua sp.]